MIHISYAHLKTPIVVLKIFKIIIVCVKKIKYYLLKPTNFKSRQFLLQKLVNIKVKRYKSEREENK